MKITPRLLKFDLKYPHNFKVEIKDQDNQLVARVIKESLQNNLI